MRSRPYGVYAVLIAAYWVLLGGVILLVQRLRRPLPEGFTIGDLVALGFATYRLSRDVTYDRVTSVIRLPFVEPGKGPTRPEGTKEAPTGQGLQLALGQLFT